MLILFFDIIVNDANPDLLILFHLQRLQQFNCYSL